jgi:hypothetical protein
MNKKQTHLLPVALNALVAASCLWAATLRAAEPAAAPKASLPLGIYDDKGSASNHYIPSGWMGNAKAVKMDEGCANNPHSGKTCLKFEYNANDNWAGVVWQDPANDWGDVDGGWNLTGAKKLTFWARGEKGDELISFKLGILGSDKKFPDSGSAELADTKLTKEWKKYTIELEGKDLSRIKTGFVWSLAGQGAPVVFYLDDMKFE